MNINTTYQNILEYISSIEVIDTHEHIEPLEMRRKKKVDIFNVLFSQYIDTDLVSSGMPVEEHDVLQDDITPIDKKWDILCRYLENVKNTGYYKAVENAINGLFSIEELNADTYRNIDRMIKNKNCEDLYPDVIKNKCKIKYCLWDNLFGEYDYSPEFFKKVKRIDDFIMVGNEGFIKSLELKSGRSIESLDDYMNIMKEEIYSAKNRGYLALKNAIAYERILHFDDVEYRKAKIVFEKLLCGKAIIWQDLKKLQDYIVHASIKLSIELGMKLQIHTGLHAGNGNYITNSNPVHLTNIFKQYPNAQFDLFHGGYPYGGELSVLAKNFPNVYIDMSWTHVISPSYCIRYLEQWLDTVPINKIFGFGGDYISVEMVFGHLILAKENIALTLSNMVQKQKISVQYAKKIAKKILYDNPADFFGL